MGPVAGRQAYHSGAEWTFSAEKGAIRCSYVCHDIIFPLFNSSLLFTVLFFFLRAEVSSGVGVLSVQ